VGGRIFPSGGAATLFTVFRDLRGLASWTEHHRRLVQRATLALLLTIVVVFVCATLMDVLESGKPTSEIHGFGDAFFFATVQALTVSSQLKNPVTPAGRVVDVFLEIWALVVVTGLAGSFASFFLSMDSQD